MVAPQDMTKLGTYPGESPYEHPLLWVMASTGDPAAKLPTPGLATRSYNGKAICPDWRMSCVETMDVGPLEAGADPAGREVTSLCGCHATVAFIVHGARFCAYQLT